MGKLFRQFAFSYVLVSLVATLSIEIATTLIPAIQEVQRGRINDSSSLNKQDMQRFASYLQQPTANPDALRYWIAIPAFDALHTAYPSLSFLAVTNSRGQILASTACGTTVLLASPTLHCARTVDEQREKLLQLSQIEVFIQHWMRQNNTSTFTLTGHLLSGESLRMELLVGDGKQQSGALVMIFHGPPPVQNTTDTFWQSFGSALLDYLHPEGLYFMLFASAFGTLFGLLISRNLTRRLERITRAAEAWSRGDFTVAVKDRSTDELGQLTRDLNRMVEQLQFLLSSRLSLAVVEERNRLALDLHDSVKQQVFSNALLVHAARTILERNPQKASQHLQEAEQIAERIQRELIELISALRPAAIASQGLVTATRAYLNDWSSQTGIATELHVQGEQVTPLDMEVTLYRVIQEGLANVARHSQARQVAIILFWELEQFRLSISDNGKGFSVPQAWGKGVGLASMQERIAHLMGNLIVESSEQGTLITVSIPLPYSAAEKPDKVEAKMRGNV
ncbi:HAMP domain-containing sensor histidine kinase [Dictyobacter arantiisoli]|uniref:histidine kinase n=1 Tax=Dictyobacter arantiisoli TaxID=2014874 RepID=A0A5A5TAX7_9CHLR|nr:sensor histidine kinase [Dictyobacter arantiisoli]GCF08641.1 hypothetical protein KDI_22050 [Dictyobacter arantiisoli]